MLEDHAEAALRRRQAGHVLAGQQDLAAVGGLETGEQAQGGGLAAAREAQESQDLALGQR